MSRRINRVQLAHRAVTFFGALAGSISRKHGASPRIDACPHLLLDCCRRLECKKLSVEMLSAFNIHAGALKVNRKNSHRNFTAATANTRKAGGTLKETGLVFSRGGSLLTSSSLASHQTLQAFSRTIAASALQ